MPIDPASAEPPADAIAARPQLAAAPSVVIGNRLVSVRVLVPDAETGFYRGTRFDWAGAVASLTYRDREFYGPWFDKIAASVLDFAYDGQDIVAGPNTMMMGPADEFDTRGPIGWAQAPVGGVAVKIGVGALRKPDLAAYSQFRTFEVIDPGRRTMTADTDAVTFTHELEAAGYAYHYEKTLRLPAGAPRLLIEHRLRNTGGRAFTTSVYNHNFLTFGGGGIGEGLSIEAGFPMVAGQDLPSDAAVIRGNRLDYLRLLGGRDRVAAPIAGFGGDAADNRVRIADAGRGMAVTFQGDRPLTHVELWSIRSVVSVEPFVSLNVAPGEEVGWAYAYDYEAP